MGDEGFSLSLPARADLVGTARLFASSLGRQFGLDEETVEDLKLGVSEACAIFLRGGDGGESEIVVAAERGGGRLSFSVRNEGGELGADLEAEQDVRLEILRALFEDAAVEGSAISFSVPL